MKADPTLRADVGIIGGSGLYELFPDARVIDVTTPYGEPSASITLAEIGSRTVAFLPRHGSRHELPPHRVNYRATSLHFTSSVSNRSSRRARSDRSVQS